MRRIISLTILLIPYCLIAQIFPKEGSQLNYRIIGFSFPQYAEGKPYTIEIAQGHFNNLDSFSKNIIKILAYKTNRQVTDVPDFGSDYTWCIRNVKDKKSPVSLHHFSTGTSSRIDSTTRLRITTDAEKYEDAYFFADATGVLYDMTGNPVWYLPNIKGKINETTPVRDLKMSAQGTITFMSFQNIYEISYDGALLWAGPNTGAIGGDTSEDYHHEFTRLDNGNYMTMGKQTVTWDLPSYRPDTTRVKDVYRDSSGGYHQHITFGTLIEYNSKGKVVWSWAAANYFKSSDLAELKGKNGQYNMGDTHANAFFFDEQHKYVYMGFRNISRIIKIKYPEGNVVAEYGNKYVPGSDELDMGNDLFCGQHSIRRSADGSLYVFNNNSFAEEVLPKVDVMQEPVNAGDTLKKIWEYKCTLDGLNDSERNVYSRKMERKLRIANSHRPKAARIATQFSAGGNVIELPDKSFFVSTCSPFSKVFIVDRNEKILWNCVIEKMLAGSNSWTETGNYRASIITRSKDLEQLIWSAQKR